MIPELKYEVVDQIPRKPRINWTKYLESVPPGKAIRVVLPDDDPRTSERIYAAAFNAIKQRRLGGEYKLKMVRREVYISRAAAEVKDA